VEADFAVELGAGDETLEFPWAGCGGVCYYDLKRQPELIALIEEARDLKALSEFLVALNSSSSPFETAKCDAWSTAEISPEEEIFGGAWKFGSYVDLLFSDERRFSFPAHETMLKRWKALLQRVPDIPAAAEFIVRRCFFKGEPSDGFYVTLYTFGYGEDEDRARTQWAIGLKLVENAIRQAETA
jgi:hypothetical protein